MTLQVMTWYATAPCWMPVFAFSVVHTSYEVRQWKKAQLVDKYGDPVHPRLAKKWKGKGQPRHFFDL